MTSSPPKPDAASKSEKSRTMKVAIVGSGLAGLSAAYLLSTLRMRKDVEFKGGAAVDFEVQIFEKAATLGMDSHSVSLALPDAPDAEWRVDVPMRAFQGGYYPQLIRLYTHLGVAFRKADFSYSFTTLASPPDTDPSANSLDLRPHFLYEGASGRKGFAIPSAKHAEVAQEPSAVRRAFARLRLYLMHALGLVIVLLIWLRFIILCAPFFRPKNIDEMTWEEWVAKYSASGVLARWTGFAAVWESFLNDICVPMYSGICSANREDVFQHPAEEFLDFNWKTVGTHHYLVSHGIRDVVARLSEYIPTKHIHTSTPTTAIVPDPSDPSLVSIVCASPDGTTVTYDGFAHVIFATQAKYAAPLLHAYAGTLAASTASTRATELGACLARVAYRESVVVNHTDPSFLPTDARDRRDLNVVTVRAPPRTSTHELLDRATLVVPPCYSMATQRLVRPAHVPRVLGADGTEAGIYQTTNPLVAPSPASVLSVGRLERALLTVDGKQAARMLYRLDGRGVGALQGAARRAEGRAVPGLWVVGSYAYCGIPMLEGCVASARDVVAGLDGIVSCEGGKVKGEMW